MPLPTAACPAAAGVAAAPARTATRHETLKLNGVVSDTPPDVKGNNAYAALVLAESDHYQLQGTGTQGNSHTRRTREML